MAEKIVQIKSLPGIKRDGTKFEGDQYVDGQWVRFQRGLPRKIGGYRAISKYLREVSRALNEYTQDNLTYIHSGSANFVERFYIDGSYNTSVITNRTPSTLVQDDGNMWQFDVDTAVGLGGIQLVAQVAPNLGCICNNSGGQLFYGNLLDTTALQEVTDLPTGYSLTGGVVALHPYTFGFGNNGYVMWSVPGDPTNFTGAGSGAANVTGQKIVRGMQLRGGPGNSPSGLFWSADSLLRASFVGGDAVFQFDTISAQSSILGANTVIEYDGIFYWIGTDRFLMFNGVVREVPNDMNLNYFFDGINMQYRQKVFAVKVPRYGEIWWCYPRGDATEPSHAVIYNVRENTWYDCELPNGGRSAGAFASVFPQPLMTGVVPTVSPENIRVAENNDVRITQDDNIRVTEDSEVPQYKLWVHEVGTDEIDGIDLQPVYSFFETGDLSLPVSSQENKAIQVLMLEPDFVQSGDLTVRVVGRANARSPEVETEEHVIVETPQTPQEQVVYFKTQRRELRFRFASNAIGGDYQMGLILAHIQPADGTVIG
ncbi:MAG: hypothetical protein QM519_01410 [Bacteroidia bacterium]|nr:hypothetical protein [Bacteroidia bacterium]